jgi:hypothetical protein
MGYSNITTPNQDPFRSFSQALYRVLSFRRAWAAESSSIHNGEMTSAALVVLESAPLLRQQTLQFASVHSRHIAFVIENSNKNVVWVFM